MPFPTTTTILLTLTLTLTTRAVTSEGGVSEGVEPPTEGGCSIRAIRGAPSGVDSGIVGGLPRRDGADLSGFSLRVEGDPTVYRPGHSYLVTLSAAPPSFFRGFSLMSIREGSGGEQHSDFIGRFQLIDPEETRMVGGCVGSVAETEMRRRSRVTLRWQAPTSGAGCVSLSASLVQKRVIWFQEEGPLTKTLCERGREEDDTKKPIPQCCACDTAKYRLTFYGNWSQHTHPKDYPKFATHWSAIIGASHSRDYLPWEFGGLASEGVKRVAEWGSPVSMEDEMRQQGDEVLTVIKMKPQWPAWQPISVRPPPSAEFSVDRTRHLMSFLSMLGPSPDWAVGLSAENLCTRGCGWTQRVAHDLVPWDAGTDSGVTYQSPNYPTTPPERIRVLTSLDNVVGPFYDPEGGAITPVARVVVERLARKGSQCNTEPDNVDDVVSGDVEEKREADDDTLETCIYSAWSPWSSCGPSSSTSSTSSTTSSSTTSTSSCAPGRQLRQRMLKAQLDFGSPCIGTQDSRPCPLPGCPEIQEEPSCRYSDWSPWSPCSASCLPGTRSRSRLVSRGVAAGTPLEGGGEGDREEEEGTAGVGGDAGSPCLGAAQETEPCVVNEDCSVTPLCAVTEWGAWGPCSASCGIGVRSRNRGLRGALGGGGGAVECPLPGGGLLAEMDKCMMPECPSFPCSASPWSDWSPCSVSCGVGTRERRRSLRVSVSDAASSSCPHGDMADADKCMMPECRCTLAQWGPWGPCVPPCGARGMQSRSRDPAASSSASCKPARQMKKCDYRPC